MDSLPNEWRLFLEGETEKKYFLELQNFVDSERRNFTVYPPEGLLFSAFETLLPESVKVVVLGQDPYHGAGQAHGLAFSVPNKIKRPPSLRNIFKELKNDLGIDIDDSVNRLDSWAKEGVLLINATLTVREASAGSHQKKGWEVFTDSVIRKLSDRDSLTIFILWGRYAHSKEKLITDQNNHIIKSAHPSPLSAYRGFFGSKPFSKVNNILIENGHEKIKWELT